jgi:hypothetical protein
MICFEEGRKGEVEKDWVGRSREKEKSRLFLWRKIEIRKKRELGPSKRKSLILFMFVCAQYIKSSNQDFK